MSDHWNSLADLLGTPSIDPPHKKAAPPKKAEVETARTPSEPSFRSSTPAKAVDEQDSITSTAQVSDAFSPPSAPTAKTEQPSRLRSSWDTVARLFGVSSSAELAPSPPADSSASMKTVKEIESDPEDDLFAGFGRKPERSQDEESPRKQPERTGSDREPASRPKKKPSSLWDTPKSDMEEPSIPSGNVASSHRTVEPVSRFSSDDTENVPERRGRSRNIRRGRNSEGDPESVRNMPESPDAEPSRDRERNEARIEPVARRNDRNEKSSEGNRSGRGERPERPAARPSQERLPSGDRAQSTDRAASGERSPTADRPPRDSVRRSRNDGRVARTSDRADRPEKRNSETDDAQPVRSGERSSRSERPVRDSETQDRPGRSRGQRREPQPVEDEGEWDSREVGFEELDELVIEREIPSESMEDGESTTTPTRGRRRRRRGGRRPGLENTEQVASEADPAGQAYGRSSNADNVEEELDEVENLRIHKVTSWLDAISPMIDSNMENHKRNPGGDRNRGGGGSRRRNSSNGGGGNR